MGNSLSFLWVLLQTIFALAFVCGLAYLIFRVILPRLTVNYGANNMVRVVDRIGLEARKSLYVIEVAGKWMIVASSESGVQFIAELDAESAKFAEAEILKNRQLPSNTAFGKSFADKLNEVIAKGKQGGK
ncbi:MAG TPA: flagellar biosynthetic protein FliO [Pyrinomonadaceae bacterium]|nr:flagellar biosynthetic protein FliO [Pyrinomonadaceae bacterium]